MLALHVLVWVMVVTVDVAWTSQGPHCNMSMQEIFSDSDNTIWSCRTRCGETYKQLPCACDERCQLYMDCCEDFTNFCLNANETKSDKADARVSKPKNHTAAMRMENLMGTVACRHRTKLISRCPNPALPLSLYGGKRITQDSVAPLCDTPLEEAENEDVNRLMPVTDAASGHHFANVYCLLCHGGKADEALPWSLNLIWNARGTRPRDIRHLLQEVLSGSGNVTTVALPPSNVKPRRCFPQHLLHNPKCDCYNLTRQCETANSSIVTIDNNYFRRLLFRHPSCAACYMVQNNNYEKILTPDIERSVIFKNSLQFAMVMRWTSPTVDKEKSVFKVEVPPNQGITVPWKDVICDMVDTSNKSYGSKDLAATFRNENIKETSNGHGRTSRETNASKPQTAEHVASLNGSSFPTLLTTAKDNDHADNSGAGLEADRVESVNSPSIQPESTRISCTQKACAYGIPLVNNVCRLDLSITEVHLLLTCSKPDHFTSVPVPDPGSAPSLPPAAIAKMTRAIQLYFDTQGEAKNVTVAGVTATRTLDGCIRNSTVSLHIPLGMSYSDNMTLQIIDRVYQALLNVNPESVDQTTQALHACGYVRRLRFFIARVTLGANIPCFLRAEYRPPEAAKIASAQRAIKANMLNLFVGVVFLLALCD